MLTECQSIYQHKAYMAPMQMLRTTYRTYHTFTESTIVLCRSIETEANRYWGIHICTILYMYMYVQMWLSLWVNTLLYRFAQFSRTCASRSCSTCRVHRPLHTLFAYQMRTPRAQITKKLMMAPNFHTKCIDRIRGSVCVYFGHIALYAEMYVYYPFIDIRCTKLRRRA